MRSLFAFVFVFISLIVVSYASPYNKYGRTCKDILCTVREECVMKKDECTGYSDKCGTYPTCKRKPGVGKTGCAAMRCPTGHFCSIRQENCDKPPCQIKPTCIAFRTPSPNRASDISEPDKVVLTSSTSIATSTMCTTENPTSIDSLSTTTTTITTSTTNTIPKPSPIEPLSTTTTATSYSSTTQNPTSPEPLSFPQIPPTILPFSLEQPSPHFQRQ